MQHPARQLACILWALILLLAPLCHAEDAAEAPAPINLETAYQILNELRLLDAIIGQWAAENNKKPGDRVPPAELRLYMRKDKDARLYKALGDSSGPKDILGNPFGEFVVAGHPQVSLASVKALAGVASNSFWQPFTPK